MSFIESKTDPKYKRSTFCTCLNLTVRTDTATITEEFAYAGLRDLRSQIEDVLGDIDSLLEDDELLEQSK